MSNSSSKKSGARIIPKDESGAFQAWDLPEVNTPEEEQLAEVADTPMVTAEQLEEIQQQAYQEGYSEGQQRGYEEGLAKGVAEGQEAGQKQGLEASIDDIRQQNFHFEQILKGLEQPYAQVSEQVEQELVELTLIIAKKVVQHEIDSHPDAILKVVKQSIQLLPSYAKQIKVILNPDDLARLRAAFEHSDELDLSQYHLVEEPHLQRGGCIVDSDISHIDASIEKRVNELCEQILPGFTSQKHDDQINSSSASEAEQAETQSLEQPAENLDPNEPDSQIESAVERTEAESVSNAQGESESSISESSFEQDPNPSHIDQSIPDVDPGPVPEIESSS